MFSVKADLFYFVYVFNCFSFGLDFINLPEFFEIDINNNTVWNGQFNEISNINPQEQSKILPHFTFVVLLRVGKKEETLSIDVAAMLIFGTHIHTNMDKYCQTVQIINEIKFHKAT